MYAWMRLEMYGSISPPCILSELKLCINCLLTEAQECERHDLHKKLSIFKVSVTDNLCHFKPIHKLVVCIDLWALKFYTMQIIPCRDRVKKQLINYFVSPKRLRKELVFCIEFCHACISIQTLLFYRWKYYSLSSKDVFLKQWTTNKTCLGTDIYRIEVKNFGSLIKHNSINNNMNLSYKGQKKI